MVLILQVHPQAFALASDGSISLATETLSTERRDSWNWPRAKEIGASAGQNHTGSSRRE